jgi:peptidyl-prolyl cis-trans isomerase SurA
VKLVAVRSTEGSPIEEQVHARHILMKPNQLQDDATVKQKLSSIRQRILQGEDFAAFASSMSEDPGSSVNGGDLGWSGPGTFVPEFESVLAGLKEDEISEPFRTQFGWHIVQLREQVRRGNRTVAAPPARRSLRRHGTLTRTHECAAAPGADLRGTGRHRP